jgi:hypothetical protein
MPSSLSPWVAAIFQDLCYVGNGQAVLDYIRAVFTDEKFDPAPWTEADCQQLYEHCRNKKSTTIHLSQGLTFRDSFLMTMCPRTWATENIREDRDPCPVLSAETVARIPGTIASGTDYNGQPLGLESYPKHPILCPSQDRGTLRGPHLPSQMNTQQGAPGAGPSGTQLPPYTPTMAPYNPRPTPSQVSLTPNPNAGTQETQVWGRHQHSEVHQPQALTRQVELQTPVRHAGMARESNPMLRISLQAQEQRERGAPLHLPQAEPSLPAEELAPSQGYERRPATTSIHRLNGSVPPPLHMPVVPGQPPLDLEEWIGHPWLRALLVQHVTPTGFLTMRRWKSKGLQQQASLLAWNLAIIKAERGFMAMAPLPYVEIMTRRIMALVVCDMHENQWGEAELLDAMPPGGGPPSLRAANAYRCFQAEHYRIMAAIAKREQPPKASPPRSAARATGNRSRGARPQRSRSPPPSNNNNRKRSKYKGRYPEPGRRRGQRGAGEKGWKRPYGYSLERRRRLSDESRGSRSRERSPAPRRRTSREEPRKEQQPTAKSSPSPSTSSKGTRERRQDEVKPIPHTIQEGEGSASAPINLDKPDAPPAQVAAEAESKEEQEAEEDEQRAAQEEAEAAKSPPPANSNKR